MIGHVVNRYIHLFFESDGSVDISRIAFKSLGRPLEIAEPIEIFPNEFESLNSISEAGRFAEPLLATDILNEKLFGKS